MGDLRVQTRNHQRIETVGERYRADTTWTGSILQQALTEGRERIEAYLRAQEIDLRVPRVL